MIEPKVLLPQGGTKSQFCLLPIAGGFLTDDGMYAIRVGVGQALIFEHETGVWMQTFHEGDMITPVHVTIQFGADQ